jgi:peptidoglycan-associated lipoprotein
MKRFFPLAAFAALSILAGCSTTPDQKAPVDDRNPLGATAPGSGTSGASTSGTGASGLSGSAIAPSAGTSTVASTARSPLTDPANILSKRSVYYDYDSYVIKDEFKPLVEAHGKYLRDNRAAHVIVQGNTDERGGREYNLALGNKRAESVKKMLSLLGVQEAQVETVSFGKEKPRNAGHDEAAWAENRRSDLVYQGE